jgi:hypothetical protein
MAGFLTVEKSCRRFLALVDELVPTSRAAKIVGFSVYDRFDPASLRKVGLAERVFYHHVINPGQVALRFRLGRRFTGQEQRLYRSIAHVDQKAKD